MWPGIWIAPIVDPNQPYILSGPIDELRSRRDIAPNILKAADGTDSLAVIGRPQPNWTLDVRSTMQFGSFTFRNIFEAAGGFIVSNETDHLRNALGNGPPGGHARVYPQRPQCQRQRRNSGWWTSTAASTTASSRIPSTPATTCAGPNSRSRISLPDAFAERLAATSAQVSLGVKNLKVFSDYLKFAEERLDRSRHPRHRSGHLRRQLLHPERRLPQDARLPDGWSSPSGPSSEAGRNLWRQP